MTNPKVDRLKTWTSYFDAVKAGEKPFELRLDDRHFEVGQTLILLRYDPIRRMFSGEYTVTVTDILRLKQFLDVKGWRWRLARAIMPNLVILGIRPIDPVEMTEPLCS